MVVTCFSRAWFTGPLAATQARDKRDGAKVRKDALESRVNTILRVIGTEEEGSLRVLKAFEEVFAFSLMASVAPGLTSALCRLSAMFSTQTPKTRQLCLFAAR